MAAPHSFLARPTRIGAAVLGAALAVLVSAAPAGAVDTVFSPTADAHVKSSSPTTNYGGAAGLQLRLGTPSNPITYRSYLKFTVSGLTGSVTAAKLRLFVTDGSNDGGTAFLASNNFTTGGAWTESGLTWNNAPPATSGALSGAGSVAAGSWVELPVTAAITGNGTFTILLTTGSTDSTIYSSKEGANPPRLVVTSGTGTSAPPSNVVRPSITGSTQVGATLTANPGQWSGTGPITYAYQWQRCSQPGTCSNITGATQQTYVLVQADQSMTIRVRVTATGAVAPPGVAFSLEVGPVTAGGQGAPVNTQAPTISGVPRQGQTLTANRGQWTGAGPITYAYQWQRCSGTTCSNISGATQQTYLLVSADVNRTIRVRVTATGAVPPPGAAFSAQVGPVLPFTSGGDAVLMAAGDIACDPSSSSFNGGNGTSSACRQLATSDLVLAGSPNAVLALGDLQYENATLSDFNASYNLSWGRFYNLTRPVAGNHEYQTPGASGYYDYWNRSGQDRAHRATNGYYSFDLGAWHIVVLNSNCSQAGGCGANSPQEQWLRADLAAHPAACTLAAWHHPRFNMTSTGPRTNGSTNALWQTLYAHGAEIILNGHIHHYERWAPQTPAGAFDSNGIREFIVGTGGVDVGGSGSPGGNLQAIETRTFGVLRLALHPTSYDWRFLPIAGQSFSDSGSAACH